MTEDRWPLGAKDYRRPVTTAVHGKTFRVLPSWSQAFDQFLRIYLEERSVLFPIRNCRLWLYLANAGFQPALRLHLSTCLQNVRRSDASAKLPRGWPRLTLMLVDLISQSIALFRWKPLGGFEDFLLDFKCQSVDSQILKARYLLAHFVSVLRSQLLPSSAFGLPLSVRCPPSSVIRHLTTDL